MPTDRREGGRSLMAAAPANPVRGGGLDIDYPDFEIDSTGIAGSVATTFIPVTPF